MPNNWRVRSMVSVLMIGGAVAACGTGASDSPEARRARGIELVNAAGREIASAQSFSFRSTEHGERVRRSGEKEPVTIEQIVQVRRPDRLHLKATGGQDLEVYYDGAGLTLMSHAQKVYGSVPAKGPLTDVIPDAIDRYDIPFPLGDLIAFTSADRLIDEQTRGGWEGEETRGGLTVDRVAWQHANLDWTVWIAREGRPLVARLDIHYKARRGSPRRSYELSDWQFDAELPDPIFVARVPGDYEGIPVIQRASAVQEQIEQAKEAAAAAKEK